LDKLSKLEAAIDEGKHLRKSDVDTQVPRETIKQSFTGMTGAPGVDEHNVASKLQPLPCKRCGKLDCDGREEQCHCFTANVGSNSANSAGDGNLVLKRIRKALTALKSKACLGARK